MKQWCIMLVMIMGYCRVHRAEHTIYYIYDNHHQPVYFPNVPHHMYVLSHCPTNMATPPRTTPHPSNSLFHQPLAIVSPNTAPSVKTFPLQTGRAKIRKP